MDNKCLVTKLKASVDNPNLPRLGSFELYVHIPQDQSQRIQFTEEATMHFPEGDVTIPGHTAYSLPKGEYTLCVTSKYHTMPYFHDDTDIDNFVDFNVEQFKFIDGDYSKLGLRSDPTKARIYGNIDVLPAMPALRLFMGRCGCSATISNIVQKYSGMTEFMTEGMALYGDISELGKTHVGYIHLPNTKVTNLYGELYTFVENKRLTTPTRDSWLNMNYMRPYQGITLFGKSAPSSTFFALKWTPDTVTVQIGQNDGSAQVTTYNNQGEVIG